MLRIVSFAIALPVLLTTTGSRAAPEDSQSDPPIAPEDGPDPRDTRFSDRPLKLHARAGIATPVGLIGGTLTLDLHDRVGVGLGAGSNVHGLQLAALARLRPLIWQGNQRLLRAVVIELAVSTGPGSGGVLPPADGGEGNGLSYTWSRITWVQAEAQYEVLRGSGLSFLAGIGLAVPVANSGAPTCHASVEGVTCNSAKPPNAPSVAMSISGAIGSAF